MAKRKKIKTYEAKMDGKKVRVTVPESASVESMEDMLKENLSPHAVAAIAAYLRAAIGTNDPDVDKEVNWFQQKLEGLLANEQEFNALCKELGL
jgi:predicted metal-dependent hydrolase